MFPCVFRFSLQVLMCFQIFPYIFPRCFPFDVPLILTKSCYVFPCVFRCFLDTATFHHYFHHHFPFNVPLILTKSCFKDKMPKYFNKVSIHGTHSLENSAKWYRLMGHTHVRHSLEKCARWCKLMGHTRMGHTRIISDAGVAGAAVLLLSKSTDEFQFPNFCPF